MKQQPFKAPCHWVMGLPRRRVTGKANVSGVRCAQNKSFDLRQAQASLPSLYSHTQGKDFGSQVWTSWLQKRLSGKAVQIPKAREAGALLRKLAQKRRLSGKLVPPPGTWKSHGVKYVDEEGSAGVDNLAGFQQRVGEKSRMVSWNEYGLVYRLCRTGTPSRGTYAVVRTKAFKKMSSVVSKRDLRLRDDSFTFKSSVVMDRRTPSAGSTAPRWTLIYLHSFSQKGKDYLDFPHYFSVCGASLKVVVPSAPLLEQQCFKDWNVWRGERLGWRRIKFNAWFDYLTDKAGSAENHICLESLLSMRENLHSLIRQEVKLAGDPKRVIIGGVSQGCCVALDAAMTYEQELGGVIGLVGHILGSTPLDASKRNMPLHLFHEASDREMRWSWVKDTVKRLVDEGFKVHSKRESDPSGSGHWIQEIEGSWVRSALRQIIFGGGNKMCEVAST